MSKEHEFSGIPADRSQIGPIQPGSSEIADLIFRSALGLFGVLVVVAGVHRKGHHRRFGRGGSSGAMGRAFGMVLNCSISSW